MASRPGKPRPFTARRRKHRMPRFTSSEIRFTRPEISAAPNSGLVSYSKVPKKVTPWKNHLAETKPLIGIYARQPVSPCRAQSEPSFCLAPRAPASGAANSRRAQSPETPQRILPALAPSDSSPFPRAFPPRRIRTFLLCTDWQAQFACHRRAAEGTITGAGPAR